MGFADTQFLSEHTHSSDFDQEFPSLAPLVTTIRDGADLCDKTIYAKPKASWQARYTSIL